jgi:Na+-translocating ferredoxin:NAD+ oxidoreductase subunit E
MMGAGSARTSEAPLAVLLLAFIPSVAVAVHVMDALWMAAGVLVVMTGSAVARAFLEARHAGGAPLEAGDGPGSTGRWLRTLVISSLLTAAFEAGLLAVDPAASAALGIYAPLIAVNFLVVGGDRAAEALPLAAAAAALRKGAWFAAGLVTVSLAREVLGAGTITLFPAGSFRGTIMVSALLDQPVRALGLAGGGLLCLGYLAAAVRAVSARKSERMR